MSPIPTSPRGMYFEEFEPGQHVVTAGRTVTEADVVAFAGLSGDFNQIHTDSQLASGTLFGQRIAHGLLVTAIASGLTVQTGIIEGTVIAFREITDWKFIKPVFFGDTVHVEAEVMETKPFRRLGGGMVAIELNVNNQAGETVIKGTWTFLVASKPE